MKNMFVFLNVAPIIANLGESSENHIQNWEGALWFRVHFVSPTAREAENRVN